MGVFPSVEINQYLQINQLSRLFKSMINIALFFSANILVQFANQLSDISLTYNPDCLISDLKQVICRIS